MNSYKAEYQGVFFGGIIYLIIHMGFGLTLKKSLKLADIEFNEKQGYDSVIEKYCSKSNFNVTISTNENDEIYVFNGVDSNHLNAVLVEEGYAKYI